MQTSSRGITPDDREKLRSHVVNLRQGRFSTDGDFITTRQDVDRLFTVDLPAALEEAKAAKRKLRVLFYAHGGLVSESSGIAGALAQLDFWKGNHIYPIFFVWETGILEVIADDLRKQLLGQRGVTDFIKEAQARLFESLARPGGLRAWNNMKLSAQAASAAGGGARVVIDLAETFFRANAADVGSARLRSQRRRDLPGLLPAAAGQGGRAGRVAVPARTCRQHPDVQVDAAAARRQGHRGLHDVHHAS